MRLTRTKGLCLAAAAGALTIASAGLAAPAFAGPAVDGVSTTLVGSGSDTTHAVMHRLDAVYAGAPGCVVLAAVGTPQPLDGNCVSPTPALTTAVNPDHDNVVEKYPLGSGNGINQLCQQGLANVLTVDFARSSRGPSGSDCNGLQFVSFARDGISWFHFSQVGGVNTPSNAVTNLTQDQIRKIFVTGEINNWSQVGGTNAPIVVYAAQAGSGTRSTFDGLIGGSSIAQIPAPSQSTHVITENNAQPIITNGDAANAIFYESYGRYQQSSPGNSTQTVGAADGLGNIDGITPDATTIGNSTFPFGRSLYNVLRYPSEATKRYLDPVDGFLCRTDIDNVASAVSGRKLRAEIEASIAAEGFVPLAKGTVGGGRTGQSYCRLSMPNPDVSAASVGFTVTATSAAHSAVHVTFSEQVLGVSASSLVLANAGGTPVAASVTCTNAAGVSVACDSGPVLSADIASVGTLGYSTAYHAATTGAITDRAGNASSPASSAPWTTEAATVVKSGQQVTGVVKSLKRNRSAALPTATIQGTGLAWASSTPTKCKVKAGKVVAGKKVGNCVLVANAAGTASLLPLTATFAVKIK